MTFQDFRRWWWGGVLAWLLLGLGMRVAPPAQAAGSVEVAVAVDAERYAGLWLRIMNAGNR